MANKTWKFSQRAAVLAVSLLLGTAAQAGLVRGTLDPPATVNIPAYNGFAIFEVADDCLVGDGWKFTNTGGCGPVFMQSATINLYGNTLGDPPIPPIQATLNFGEFAVSDVFGILVAGGEVLGIDSTIMGYVPGNGTYSSENFWLRFVTGCNEDPTCGLVPPPETPGNFALAEFTEPDPRALLYNSRCKIDVATDFAPAVDCILEPAFSSPTDRGGLTFAAVPEPGTLGLILGALGGGWLARRRKKKTAA